MDDRLTKLNGRVSYWLVILQRLGISHWNVEVSIVDEPDGSYTAGAAVKQSVQYDTAEIEFAENIFDTKTDDEIDEIIVHELLHMVFRDLWEAITEPEYMFGKPAWTSHYNRVEHEAEGVIDRLARTIVELNLVQSQNTDKENNTCTSQEQS